MCTLQIEMSVIWYTPTEIDYDEHSRAIEVVDYSDAAMRSPMGPIDTRDLDLPEDTAVFYYRRRIIAEVVFNGESYPLRTEKFLESIRYIVNGRAITVSDAVRQYGEDSLVVRTARRRESAWVVFVDSIPGEHVEFFKRSDHFCLVSPADLRHLVTV